ncbi:MAG: hypothetical protein HY215_07075 [Candidatus Rokubacteria bacterium]|nr:hypothetical protein [Candidatus Rokubacteria bacterium]
MRTLPVALFLGTSAWSFVGPVVATTLLTWTTPPFLYALLAVPGLACLPLVRRRLAPRPGDAEILS